MKTKEQFFEWVGIRRLEFAPYKYITSDRSKNVRNYAHEMLWALIAIALQHDESLDYTCEIAMTTREICVRQIESATGKKWPDIVEFLEDKNE